MLAKRPLSGKMLAGIKRNPSRNRKIQRFETLVAIVQRYCTDATLHGLRYAADPRLHPIERCLWLLVFVVHFVVAVRVIVYLTINLQEAPTSIGIDSMNYRISGVPFPSVTICPNDRVDWDKAVELEKRIFPNSTDQRTLDTFRDVLTKLSVLSFGEFHRLDFLKHRRLDGLMDLNVTDALLRVTPSCEQLLSDCWWRSMRRDCCEIFELHKTEYGFCYSFNSQMAEAAARRKYRRHSEKRPRRATSYGAWSGVRVTARLSNVTKPPYSEETDGVLFMVEDPRVWPKNGRVIPTNSLTTVSFECISGFATQSILDLDAERAPCRHSAGRTYTQETCISLCKREYVIKHCGCNPSFLFPSNSHRNCNLSDFLCLIDHNDLYKENVITGEKEPIDKDAMICDCPPECDYHFYMPHLAAVRTYQSQDITLDVHFSSRTNFRFKTDLVFTHLNYLVSFGGIIGLFLGGSLLSMFELIYYLMVVLFSYVRARCASTVTAARTGSRLAVPPTFRAAAIQDYGPVKPRSRRSPILVNYTPVKSNFNRY
ncbi:pickpocket protein 19-like [Andrena cerasifolii]|uniref:pickpocket protein 19-like n=1 Tax=Andrena cerasifolii TaxID=2819439 RepID=UPI0040378982